MTASPPVEAPQGPLAPLHGATPDEGGTGAVLVALGDPTRRQLFEALAEAGEATATALASPLPISRQAVVKHLSVLESAGLVTGRRAGREVLYHARSEPLETSAHWMASLAATCDRRLASLKRRDEPAAPGVAGELGAAPSWRVW